MRTSRRVLVLAVALAACGDLEAPVAQSMAGEEAPAPASAPRDFAEREEGKLDKKMEAAKPKAPSRGKRMMAFAEMDGAPGGAAAPAAPPMEERRADEVASAEGNATSGAAPTRAWFPETFLFEPMIETDDAGRAAIDVRVPDRLTTWRVLALAHTRDGSQAGAETSFLGTLPTYVDPVVPPFLLAGDEIRLPVQVVNTTEEPVETSLVLEALGATVQGGGRVSVPAGGSKVELATLRVPRPGPIALRASLGGTDAVARAIPVEPRGRPVEQRLGGTLAAPRSMTLAAPADADPASARVRLLVYPGALGLLRSELGAATGRGGIGADAHTLLLAGRAAGLLSALGEPPQPDALRSMGLVAGQRVLRHARAPDPATAALLAEAAAAHPENPVLARLAERLGGQVAASQRPDGTCGGGAGWSLQRVLVATADCVRAVKSGAGPAAEPRARQRAASVALKASGAVERNVERVLDAYTAAALVSSGAVEGKLADRLRERVRKAVVARPDGSRYLPVEEGVVRADGARPSELEATALAALALEGDAEAPWRADLGATLLGGYLPSRGWGDGQANLHALRAVLSLFSQPLPKEVRVVLAVDGREVASGVLDATKTKDVLAIEAPAGAVAGEHRYELRAEPAVAGLGFALELTTWVPWEAEPPSDGLELRVTGPAEAQVGKPATVELLAAAPAGLGLELRHALPAGVQADTASLDALVSQGRVAAYDTEDGAVTLTVPALSPGQTFQASYRVVPTLAGRLSARASTLSAPSRPGAVHHVPPAVWTIR